MRLTAKSPALPQRRKILFAGIAAVLMMSLAVSVATRFVHHYAYSHTVTAAHSFSPQQKRQDLEKDALQWAPPAVQASILQAAIAREELPPIRILPSESLLEQSLYNRPPPVL